jgi:hypothetical protein
LLKARSRKLSLILVLAMLMTMFAGLGTASAAAVDYSAYGVPTVKTENAFNKTLGTVLIEIDQARYLNETDNWVTLKMPSGVKIQDGNITDPDLTKRPSVQVKSVTGDVYGAYSTGADGPVQAIFKNSTTVDLMIAGQAFPDLNEEIKITLTFTNVKVQSGSGNLDVTFIPQGGSVLPGGSVTIANIVSKGATQAMVSSVKSLPEGVHDIDSISIGELSPGVFAKAKGERIEIELPAGVKWSLKNEMPGVGAVPVAGAWDFTGKGPLTGQFGQLTSVLNPKTAGDSRIVELTLNSKKDILYVDFLNNLSASKAGRIDIGGNGYYLAIDIDEDDARKGEIKAKISSKGIDGVTKQDLVIAKYGDFETTVTENEVTEIIAGQDEQELGSFYIEETLKGSLVGGRTIVLELPSGVKWNTAPDLTAEKGEINYTDSKTVVTDKRVRYTLDDFSDSAGKILVEDGEVYVEPGFEGDVEIEVSGTAGAKGTVKVAKAVKAVDLSVSAVPNIIVGEQNVMTGDIIIKENVAEAIQEGDIVIELAGGYEFYKEPTVKVTEGDLEIDDVDINNDEQLVITFDKQSNDASTITISDIYVTGYRYAPYGPVVAKFVAAKGNTDKDEFTGSTALDTLYIAPDKGVPSDDSKDNKYSEKSVGEVTIANCVTPAEGAGVAEFKIGSNVYYAGGVAKVMDVAPYIKGDRTYVPMRYLGEMLGAEVVWDDAARTVTLTKGDTTVVFTIGSTSYTVNGEAKTADVAPEITNDRTMLPARFVAEAFGAVVGWDAVSQTVVVQIAQ